MIKCVIPRGFMLNYNPSKFDRITACYEECQYRILEPLIGLKTSGFVLLVFEGNLFDTINLTTLFNSRETT